MELKDLNEQEWRKLRLILGIVAIVGIAIGIATVSITIYNVTLLNVQEAVAKVCIQQGGEWVVGPDGQKECIKDDGG